MDKLSQFFEGALVALATYPVTLFRLLFRPSKVVGSVPEPLTCPPPLAITISTFLYWWAHAAMDEIVTGGKLETRLPSSYTLTATILLLGVVLIFMRVVVRSLLGSNKPGRDAIEDLKLLSYPASVALAAAALLTVLAINFPEATISVAPHLDSAFELVAHDPESLKLALAVDTVQRIPVTLLGGWSLYNVLRAGFGAPPRRALFTTVATMVVAAIVIVCLTVAAERTSTMIRALSCDQARPCR